MSQEKMVEIIKRAVADGNFRSLLATDPQRALSEYELTQDEVETIRQSLAGDQFDTNASAVEERTSRASIPLAEMLGLLGDIPGSAESIHEPAPAPDNDPIPTPGPRDEVSIDPNPIFNEVSNNPIPLPGPAHEVGHIPIPVSHPVDEHGVTMDPDPYTDEISWDPDLGAGQASMDPDLIVDEVHVDPMGSGDEVAKIDSFTDEIAMDHPGTGGLTPDNDMVAVEITTAGETVEPIEPGHIPIPLPRPADETDTLGVEPEVELIPELDGNVAEPPGPGPHPFPQPANEVGDGIPMDEGTRGLSPDDVKLSPDTEVSAGLAGSTPGEGVAATPINLPRTPDTEVSSGLAGSTPGEGVAATPINLPRTPDSEISSNLEGTDSDDLISATPINTP
ncbi:MAG: hypothetical protein MUO76_14785 [Anaerolineaceae bacterium]|nr:hypothetical protein [Anaerolineaceae bacterium]